VAANALCETREIKKTYCTYLSELTRLLKYCDRDDVDTATRRTKDALVAIYDELQKRRMHSDNTDLMVQINAIVNEYVQVGEEPASSQENKRFDISQINFDLLRREFAKAAKKNLILKDLDDLVQQRLDQMLRENPCRIDYYERYQEIITAYNAEQDRASIEKTFMELMELANSMDTEQQRYVREGFSSDEELSMYDLLFTDNLSKQDIQAIKKVAVDLLAKIKQKIAELDHWTDKQETKAMIDNLIRDTLWAQLPECYDEISISGYRQKIYEYVYTRYRGVA